VEWYSEATATSTADDIPLNLLRLLLAPLLLSVHVCAYQYIYDMTESRFICVSIRISLIESE
jgi:hypothetical protein